MRKTRDLFFSNDLLLHYYSIALCKAPKPSKMSKTQYYNYLAIQLLEEMGNDCPTQEAIDFVEAAVKRFSRKKRRIFHINNRAML